MSIVYNGQSVEVQGKLWNEIFRITFINLPWLTMGDFNDICTREEHKEGSFSYYSHKDFLFNDFIISNSLLDVCYIGLDFCTGPLGPTSGLDYTDVLLILNELISSLLNLSLTWLELHLITLHFCFLLGFKLLPKRKSFILRIFVLITLIVIP